VAIRNPEYRQFTTAVGPDETLANLVKAGGEIGMGMLAGGARANVNAEMAALDASGDAQNAADAALLSSVNPDTGTELSVAIANAANALPSEYDYAAVNARSPGVTVTGRPDVSVTDARALTLDKDLARLRAARERGGITDTALDIQARAIRKKYVDKYPGLQPQIDQVWNNWYNYDETFAQQRLFARRAEAAEAAATTAQNELRDRAKRYNIDINQMTSDDPIIRASFLRKLADAGAADETSKRLEARLKYDDLLALERGDPSYAQAQQIGIDERERIAGESREVTRNAAIAAAGLNAGSSIMSDPNVVAARNLVRDSGGDPKAVAMYNAVVDTQVQAFANAMSLGNTQTSRAFLLKSPSEQKAYLDNVRATVRAGDPILEAMDPAVTRKFLDDGLNVQGLNIITRLAADNPALSVFATQPDLVKNLVAANTAAGVLGDQAGKRVMRDFLEPVNNALAYSLKGVFSDRPATTVDPFAQLGSKREASAVLGLSTDVLRNPKTTELVGTGVLRPEVLAAHAQIAAAPVLNPNVEHLGTSVPGGGMSLEQERASLEAIASPSWAVAARGARGNNQLFSTYAGKEQVSRLYNSVLIPRLRSHAQVARNLEQAAFPDGLNNYIEARFDSTSGGYAYSLKPGAVAAYAKAAQTPGHPANTAWQNATAETVIDGGIVRTPMYNTPEEFASAVLGEMVGVLDTGFGRGLGPYIRAIRNVDPANYDQPNELPLDYVINWTGVAGMEPVNNRLQTQ
jgi:hypothetical protein